MGPWGEFCCVRASSFLDAAYQPNPSIPPTIPRGQLNYDYLHGPISLAVFYRQVIGGSGLEIVFMLHVCNNGGIVSSYIHVGHSNVPDVLMSSQGSRSVPKPYRIPSRPLYAQQTHNTLGQNSSLLPRTTKSTHTRIPRIQILDPTLLTRLTLTRPVARVLPWIQHV